MTTIDIDLPARPEGPRLARRQLARLEREVAPAVLDNVRLLVSELVTNSVRHAGLPPTATISLAVRIDSGRIRVEVRDPGPGFQARTITPTMYQTSGWGLYLVERLADRWGVVRREATSVWFELDEATSRRVQAFA
jgi:anti-sigma regulatory factor (Ser/Thr protein kinase)